MAKKSRKIAVIYTPTSKRDLDEIWEYNAERYSVAHAADYQRFLHKRTDSLEELSHRGRRVPTRPEYRYLIFRRGRGHGYVVVYYVLDAELKVLRYFHTAQNWQDRIKNA